MGKKGCCFQLQTCSVGLSNFLPFPEPVFFHNYFFSYLTRVEEGKGGLKMLLLYVLHLSKETLSSLKLVGVITMKIKHSLIHNSQKIDGTLSFSVCF